MAKAKLAKWGMVGGKATDRQHGEAASDKRGGKNGTDKIRALKSYGNANTF